MMRLSKSDDYQPLAWVGACPVYASTALVAIHVATALLVAFLVFLGQGALFAHFYFSSQAIKEHYEVWQFVTYPFVHFPGLMFVLEMVFFFWFGRQVELFIGRRDFLVLYGLLLILPPCALMAIGAFVPTSLAGSSTLHFCIFIAFACLYPNAELFFSIKAKWVAGILFGINWIFYFSYHQWADLLVLCVSASLALFFIGRLRYGFEFPSLSRIKKWVIPAPARLPPARKRPEASETEDLLVTVDSLLEKISSKGIASLTEKERRQLSQASDELKRRERTSNHGR